MIMGFFTSQDGVIKKRNKIAVKVLYFFRTTLTLVGFLFSLSINLFFSLTNSIWSLALENMMIIDSW